MVFSSNIFLFFFLPLVLASYFLLPRHGTSFKAKNFLLLIASLFFYAWGEPSYLLLLLISIFANYFFGILIARQSAQPLPHQEKKAWIRVKLFFAIAFNILLLTYFKYANFLIENLNHILAQIPLPLIKNTKIHLPIGISFFTFHAISYLVDIYRGKSKAQKNIFDLALYITFFPQLIAGPIVRYNFIAKYLTKRKENLFFAVYGIRRFIIGLGKKIIIANPLGELADSIFNSSLSEIDTRLAWVGIACYTLQIYFDFSGYSDMAVGLARIFGFKFPENFNYPYVARSIKEFWRRWHISLSAWFRDYVYIPLGGNRVSLSRQYFNLILVFFLCGLWHGASWNFIIWGLFHGFFLVFENLKVGKNFIRAPLNFLPKICQNFYVILVVMVGWVFFRSADLPYAINYLQIMFFGQEIEVISSEISRLVKSHFIWMSFAFALIGITPIVKNSALKLLRSKSGFRKKSNIVANSIDLFLLTIFILAIVRISAATHNPFIYFQF